MKASLSNILYVPSPLICLAFHRARDTAEEPMASLMREICIKAAHTASLRHTFQASWQVSKSVLQMSQKCIRLQRSRGNFVRRSASLLNLAFSIGQTPRCMSWQRHLTDGSPSPAYLTEWVAALQLDIMTQGGVKVDNKLVSDVQPRKKNFSKFYCKLANILADQKKYTLNAFSYLLTLGNMEKRDFLCMNVTKHEMVK